MHPKVVIIILNWNDWKNTIECLESIYRINYPNYEVILVDNDSKDNSIKKIEEYCNGEVEVHSKFFTYTKENKPIDIFNYKDYENFFDLKENDLLSSKRLILIKNHENYGFAEGNNIGIRFALKKLNSKFILLLNNDTVVDADFLENLVQVADGDPQIGIVGPKVYYYNQEKKISIIGGKINFYTGRTNYPDLDVLDDGHEKPNMKVDYISGCCLLIKTDLVSKIGLLDPDYFLYYEDTEWCFRAGKSGYTSVYVPLARIWHKISSTGTRAKGVYYLTRNRLWFIKENATKFQFLSFLVFFILYFIFHSLRHLIYYHDTGRLLCFYKGVIDGFKMR